MSLVIYPEFYTSGYNHFSLRTRDSIRSHWLCNNIKENIRINNRGTTSTVIFKMFLGKGVVTFQVIGKLLFWERNQILEMIRKCTVLKIMCLILSHKQWCVKAAGKTYHSFESECFPTWGPSVCIRSFIVIKRRNEPPNSINIVTWEFSRFV